MLGLGIPLGVVAVCAVVAALVVPGIVADQQAEDAAIAYEQQQEAWEAAYSADRLEPFATFSADALVDELDAVLGETTFDATGVTAGDATGLASACADVDGLAQDATALGAVAAPDEPSVAGGEGNAFYEHALAQWQQHAEAYATSQALPGALEDAFGDIAAVCALVLQEHEIVSELADRVDALADGMQLSYGESQQVTIDAAGWIDFTCLAEIGCPPFDDAVARADVGARWDAAYTAAHSGLADLYADLCPTVELADACAAMQTAQADDALLAAAVGEAFPADDPVSVVLDAAGASVSPVPTLDEATAAYVSGTAANLEVASGAVADATGLASFDEALHATVEQAAASIREAAGAVATP